MISPMPTNASAPPWATGIPSRSPRRAAASAESLPTTSPRLITSCGHFGCEFRIGRMTHREGGVLMNNKRGKKKRVSSSKHKHYSRQTNRLGRPLGSTPKMVHSENVHFAHEPRGNGHLSKKLRSAEIWEDDTTERQCTTTSRRSTVYASPSGR